MSAKTGDGVPAVLDKIVERVPYPHRRAIPKDPLRALIFDAVYDEYRGIIVYLRLVGRHDHQAPIDKMQA